jgi:hypothetical protein
MTATDISALLLAPDIPFPPNRGGRADVWRRAEALRATNCEVAVAYPGEPPSSDGEVAAQQRGIRLIAFDRGSLFAAVLSWVLRPGRPPFFMVRRAPSATAYKALLSESRAKRVNVVVSEGPWLWELSYRLSRDLGCRLVYRSHNIEHRYMKRQAQLERSLLVKARMLVSLAGLERFERNCISQSDVLLDISADDLSYWGHPKARWLPPLASRTGSTGAPRRGGVVFVGNLRTPNNVSGLRLLLKEVMPRVRDVCPALCFFVVGSSPPAELERDIEQAGAQLFKDVAEPMDWLHGADCIVNPVMYGSGVQLKMLDMLQTDRPVVTFAQGVRGLPSEVARVVDVVPDAAAMAQAILDWHARGFPRAPDRSLVRSAFSVSAFRDALMEAVSR